MLHVDPKCDSLLRESKAPAESVESKSSLKSSNERRDHKMELAKSLLAGMTCRFLPARFGLGFFEEALID